MKRLLSLLFVFCAVMSAQQDMVSVVNPLEATSVAYTWTYSGMNSFKVGFSAQGNIVLLEHSSGNDIARREHIRSGYIVEGPVVISGSEIAEMLGFREAGWQAVVRTETPNGPTKPPIRFYRKVLGGSLELKQEFNWVPAERKIIGTMTIFNRSGRMLQDVSVCRWVDIDLEGLSINQFRYSGDDTIFVLPDNSHGLGAVSTIFRNMSGGVINFVSWPTLKDGGQVIPQWGCGAGGLDSQPATDGIVRLEWGPWDTFPAGTSKTVTFHIIVP